MIRLLPALTLLVLLSIAPLTVVRAQSASSLAADAALPVAPRGPFNIAADQNVAWRIDQATGATSYCIRDIVSNAPALLAQRPPVCSAWSR